MGSENPSDSLSFISWHRDSIRFIRCHNEVGIFSFFVRNYFRTRQDGHLSRVASLVIFWGNGILGASQVSRFLFLKGVSWPCANSLIATSVVKAFLPGTMAIPTILMNRGLNNTPTTLTTKTFPDVLAMIRPTCALVVVLVSSWIPKLSETSAPSANPPRSKANSH